MQRALYNEGIEISEYKVRRIMRENGFYPETRTKYKPTRNGKREFPTVIDITPQPTLTQYCKETTFG